MKNWSKLALIFALTTSFAQAAPKVVEHDTCIVRSLRLDSGKLFGNNFTADMSLDSTKDAIRILEQKGYVFDEKFIEERTIVKEGENNFGLDLIVYSNTGIYMERQDTGQGMISNAIYRTGQFFGKQVQEIELKVLGRGISTTKKLSGGQFESITGYHRIMAHKTKNFRRSKLAKDLDFVLHFIEEDFPRCEINPDIQRHYEE